LSKLTVNDKPWLKHFSEPLIPDVSKYYRIASPPKPVEWYWVGAPSVILDENSGEYWLAYRVRNREKRGYEVHLVKSSNGVTFKTVKIFRKEEAGLISLERPALLKDPWSGKFRIYLSGNTKDGWSIYRLDEVEDPVDFDISTIKVALTPSGHASEDRTVKDPYIFVLGRIYIMLYIGSGRMHEQVHLAFSSDGINWKKYEGNPVFKLGGWHNFSTRPMCVMPTNHGFYLYYGGSNAQWYEPVFNIQLGLAFTFDFQRFFDATPDSPLLQSPTSGKYGTLRYMDFILHEDKVFFYYEAARKDDANELRMTMCELT